MSRAAAVGLGALRLAVAAALLAATSYVLGWRILYDGLHGSDSLFHLNLASWVGNCELDAILEDEPFARQMEEMYLRDLTNATEIVLVTPGHDVS